MIEPRSHITYIASMFVLGKIQVGCLPSLALQVMTEGLDTPSLRQLAVSKGDDSTAIIRLFDRTFKELDILMPTKKQAGIVVSRTIAEDVLQGNITPYEGAKKIWWDVYINVPSLIELEQFIGLASEYEDDVRHQIEYSEDITKAFKFFLENHPNIEM